MGGIFGAIGGIVGTIAGGPLGGAAGSKAGDVLGGIFGGGDKKDHGVDDVTKLLGGGDLGGALGGLGHGVNPKLAEKALSLFSKAKTPDQQNKLLDVAIKALGGEPGQLPSAMNALNGPAANPPAAQVEGDGDADDVKEADDDDDAEAAPPAHDAPHACIAGAEGMQASSANLAASATAAGGVSPTSGGLSVNGNTVDTGRYTVTASNDKDGDVKIFDKQTNSSVEAFGDPHVLTSDGDKAAFQKNGLSIMLPDGTNVSMKPTPVNAGGVATLQGALVEKNGQAVTMSGMHGGKVQTSQVQADSQDLRSQYLTQGQTVLSADKSDVGKLYLTDATGQRTTQLNSKDHETLLDGDGGAMVQHNGATHTGHRTGHAEHERAEHRMEHREHERAEHRAEHARPWSSTGNGAMSAVAAPKCSSLPWNPQQMEKMSQVLHLGAANVQNPTDQKAILQQLQSMLDQIMNPKVEE